MLARAQAAIDIARGGGDASAALRASVETLQTWVAEHKGDALAWSLLGQVAELQGLKLRALRAQAEAQAANGDIVGAIDRLRAAQRQARPGGGAAVDFVEASIIDARLRALTAQRRAQIAEMRGGPRRRPERRARAGSSVTLRQRSAGLKLAVVPLEGERAKPATGLGSLLRLNSRSTATSITMPHRL